MRLHLAAGSQLGGISQPGATSSAQQDSTAVSRSQAGANDSVRLSGPSAALNRLSADRAARIQQLSAAVKSGSYQVSSAAITGALVRHSVA